METLLNPDRFKGQKTYTFKINKISFSGRKKALLMLSLVFPPRLAWLKSIIRYC